MHSWEEGDAPDEDRDADSSGSEGDAPELTAGQQLVEHALNLYLNRALSARDFCVQMWWAGKGGIQEATLYGFRPDAPTGHYQRHLTSVLPFLRDRSKLYGITVPSYNANDFARSTHEMQALPPTRSCTSPSTPMLLSGRGLANVSLPRNFRQSTLRIPS